MIVNLKTFLQAAFNLTIAFFVIVIPLTLFVSILSYFGQLHYMIDNISNGRYPFLLASLFLFIGAMFLLIKDKKYIWIPLIALMAVIMNFIEIVPFLGAAINGQTRPSGGIEIMLSNILTSNDCYDSVKEEIKKYNPDLVILQEVDDIWINQMSSLRQAYPCGIDCSRTDNYGLSVYSKVPLENVSIEYYSYQATFVPYIIFECIIDGQKVRFMTLHTIPPFNARQAVIRNDQLKFIVSWVRASTVPTVVVGDLNVSPFSIYYKQMVKEAGLIDSRKGHGVYPSWPAHIKIFPGTAIDHILHTKELKTTELVTGKYVGSDHFPIIARIELANKY